MSTPDLFRHARDVTRASVFTLVRGSGGSVGPRVLTGRGSVADIDIGPEPAPLHAITAAQHLIWAAERYLNDYVKWAREDGHSWAEIGTALGLSDDPDRGIFAAETAFRRVAPGDSEYNRHFGWMCRSCRGTVIDHGPEAGADPAGSEPGHQDGCARLAAAVAEYQRRWAE
jgi:hypothetical protein